MALVTGGSRGIGAATARALASSGWDICLGYRVEQRGGRVPSSTTVPLSVPGRIAVAVDVADDAFGGRALQRAGYRTGPRADALGALVNCAGIVAPPSRVEDMDAARVARMLAVNVTGTLLCAGLAVRRMSSRHGGGWWGDRECLLGGVTPRESRASTWTTPPPKGRSTP